MANIIIVRRTVHSISLAWCHAQSSATLSRHQASERICRALHCLEGFAQGYICIHTTLYVIVRTFLSFIILTKRRPLHAPGRLVRSIGTKGNKTSDVDVKLTEVVLTLPMLRIRTPPPPLEQIYIYVCVCVAFVGVCLKKRHPLGQPSYPLAL